VIGVGSSVEIEFGGVRVRVKDGVLCVERRDGSGECSTYRVSDRFVMELVDVLRRKGARVVFHDEE